MLKSAKGELKFTIVDDNWVEGKFFLFSRLPNGGITAEVIEGLLEYQIEKKIKKKYSTLASTGWTMSSVCCFPRGLPPIHVDGTFHLIKKCKSCTNKK